MEGRFFGQHLAQSSRRAKKLSASASAMTGSGHCARNSPKSGLAPIPGPTTAKDGLRNAQKSISRPNAPRLISPSGVSGSGRVMASGRAAANAGCILAGSAQNTRPAPESRALLAHKKPAPHIVREPASTSTRPKEPLLAFRGRLGKKELSVSRVICFTAAPPPSPPHTLPCATA